MPDTDVLRCHYEVVIVELEEMILRRLRDANPLGRLWPAPAGLSDSEVQAIAGLLAGAARHAAAEAREAA